MRHTVNVQVNTPQRVFYALAALPRRRILAFLSQTALSTAGFSIAGQGKRTPIAHPDSVV